MGLFEYILEVTSHSSAGEVIDDHWSSFSERLLEEESVLQSEPLSKCVVARVCRSPGCARDLEVGAMASCDPVRITIVFSVQNGVAIACFGLESPREFFDCEQLFQVLD